MRVLGIDTATTIASVALVEDGRVVAEAVRDSAGRTADLLVAIAEVCAAPLELDAIAVGAGPGSFTGLRIGMATAKGIAFAAARPLWAVSSLAALAHGRDGLVCAALDARRGEIYAGLYRDGALVEPERVIAPGELAAWAGDDARFAGDALAAHPSLAALAPRWEMATPTGAAVALVAAAGARIDVVVGGAPSYLRLAEAEIKYPDGVPGALRKR